MSRLPTLYSTRFSHPGTGQSCGATYNRIDHVLIVWAVGEDADIAGDPDTEAFISYFTGRWASLDEVTAGLAEAGIPNVVFEHREYYGDTVWGAIKHLLRVA